jgi:hypothetical protein
MARLTSFSGGDSAAFRRLIVPGFVLPDGTGLFIVAFALMNLLVLLEVADRLSLKNDLEIAREIQQAMLPSGLYTGPGVETVGLSRPANTVGGDFYDILLPLERARLVVTVGTCGARESSGAAAGPALSMLRTLVDEARAGGLDLRDSTCRSAAMPALAVHHDVLRGV